MKIKYLFIPALLSIAQPAITRSEPNALQSTGITTMAEAREAWGDPLEVLEYETLRRTIWRYPERELVFENGLVSSRMLEASETVATDIQQNQPASLSVQDDDNGMVAELLEQLANEKSEPQEEVKSRNARKKQPARGRPGSPPRLR